MSVYKRKDRNGKVVGWRAVVRIKGYPVASKQWDRKQEAVDWATDVERKIKQGQYNFDLHKTQHTFIELLKRYKNEGALEHISFR